MRHRSPAGVRRAAALGACFLAALSIAAMVGGCSQSEGQAGAGGHGQPVVADTSFMADIAQNVAGDRMIISSVLPSEADPHSFEPSPGDAKVIAESKAVIINSYGLSPLLDDLIASAGEPELLVIEAAAGLAGRVPQPGEAASPGAEIDPHFWLDPVNVIQYVENIQNGLTAIDADGVQTYRSNAELYTSTLRDLDTWIRAQVEAVPVEKRLLVTNHDSFGYFADRYGFRIVGSIYPSTGGDGTPSAQHLASLVDSIEETGAPAILLEAGTNPNLADQLARETGAKVVTDLYTRSLGSNAPTYVDMMRWDVERIVEALR